MNTQEVANAFADLCKAGKLAEAGHQFWADDVRSFEAMEGPMALVESKPGVIAKGEWWFGAHEVHSVVTHGPMVNGDQFVLRFEMDVTEKESGHRMQMDEVALYTVSNGKVTEERFFYAAE